MIEQAVRGLLEGLWLDTFLRSDHGQLCYSPRPRNHVIEPGGDLAACQEEWSGLIRQDSAIPAESQQLVASWLARKQPLGGFLAIMGKHLGRNRRDDVGALIHGMSLAAEDQWQPALAIFDHLVKRGLTARIRGAAAMQRVNTKLACQDWSGLENAARKARELRPGHQADIAFLVCAARLGSRGMLFEGALQIDESLNPGGDIVQDARRRRIKRIQARMQQEIPLPEGLPTQRVVGIGEATATILAWR